MGPDYAVLISAFHHKVIFHSILTETTKDGFVHIKHIGYPGISKVHRYNHVPQKENNTLGINSYLHHADQVLYLMGITPRGFVMHT